MDKILYFTIPALLAICYFQYKNWKKYYYQGNGANLQRMAMMLGSVGALGTCLGCIMQNFHVIAWAVTLVPIVGAVLYWPVIVSTVKNFKK